MPEKFDFSKIEDSAVAEAMADRREEVVGEAREEATEMQKKIEGKKTEKSTEKEDKKYNFELFDNTRHYTKRSFESNFISLISGMKEDLEKNKYKVLISDEKSGRIPTLAFRDVIKNRTNKVPDTYFMAGPSTEEEVQKLIQTDAFNKISREIAKHSILFNEVLIVSEAAASGKTLWLLLDALENRGIVADAAVVNLTENMVWIENELKQEFPILKGNIERYVDEEKNIFKLIIKHKDHQHCINIGELGYGQFPNEPIGVYKTEDMELKSLKQKMREWENRYKGEDLEKFKEFLNEYFRHGENKMSDDELKKKWGDTVFWKGIRYDKVFRFYDDKTIQENIKKGRDDIKLLAEKALQKVWVEE